MRPAILIAGLVALGACTPSPPPTPQQVAARCDAQARAAAGPTGEALFGVTSGKGTVSRVAVNLSADYLTGRDPAAVYAECYSRLSGAAPTIPYAPALRR